MLGVAIKGSSAVGNGLVTRNRPGDATAISSVSMRGISKLTEATLHGRVAWLDQIDYRNLA